MDLPNLGSSYEEGGRERVADMRGRGKTDASAVKMRQVQQESWRSDGRCVDHGQLTSIWQQWPSHGRKKHFQPLDSRP
jgi:hypothetical protein